MYRLLCLFWLHTIYGAIPPILHVVRPEARPFSHKELACLQSWLHHNPECELKVWGETESGRSDSVSDTSWRQNIIQQEGGIWIEPDLICCKSLKALRSSLDGFITKGDPSIWGAKPGYHPEEIKDLPANAMLLDQIFFPFPLFAPLEGLCFRSLALYPSLDHEQQKILSFNPHRESKLISFKIRKTQKFVIIAFVLCLCNIVLFYMYWRRGIFLVIGKRLWVSFWHVNVLAMFLGMLGYFLRNTPSTVASAFDLLVAPSPPKKLTTEDRSLLTLCEEVYARGLQRLKESSAVETIPHVIHLIWGGESPFPESSRANLASWVRLHPSWKVKFWTDRPSRPLPVEGIERHLLEELACPHVGQYLEEADNWGEKSDLLRYEILFQEGGVYIDHDIECFSPFEKMHSTFDFYAVLEPLHPSPLQNSQVTFTNCLIGASKEHPLLLAVMDEVGRRWRSHQVMFPYKDQRSTILRTLGRTFDSFHQVLRHALPSEANLFIFPPLFIFPGAFSPSQIEALQPFPVPSAHHQWANSWYQNLPNYSLEHVLHPLEEKVLYFYRFSKRALKINSIILFTLLSGYCFSIYYERNKNMCKGTI